MRAALSDCKSSKVDADSLATQVREAMTISVMELPATQKQVQEQDVLEGGKPTHPSDSLKHLLKHLKCPPPLLDLPIMGHLQPSMPMAQDMSDKLLSPNGLLQLLDLQPQQLGPVQSLGNSESFVDQNFMPKAVDLPLVNSATEQHLAALYDLHTAGASTIVWPPQHCNVPHLQMPMMLSRHTPAAAASAILGQMQTNCSATEQLPLQLPLASACSSKDFLAQDLLLEESCMMLPPVLLDPLNKLCADQEECPLGLQQMMSELRVKPFRSLTHLEVYLDWTLSDPTRAGHMQQRVVTAKKWIVDQLSPSQQEVSMEPSRS